MDERVPATFFPYGYAVRRSPDLWRMVAAAGFAIGNHTLSHPDLVRLREGGVRYQFRAWRQVVDRIVGGRTIPYVRPPYGLYNATTRHAADLEGYRTVVMWDVDTRDWSGIPAAQVAARAERGSNGSIVLMHCGPSSTVKALPSIIAAYRSRGFRFVTIPELLEGIGPIGGHGGPRIRSRFRSRAVARSRSDRTAILGPGADGPIAGRDVQAARQKGAVVGYLMSPDAAFMRLKIRSAAQDRAGAGGGSHSGRSAMPAGTLGAPGTLRLVRFRLVLALLAAAIVPIAIGAPLIVRVGQENQTRVDPAESSAASARVASQLNGLRERLLSARDVDAVAEAPGGSPGIRSQATAALDRVARPDPVVITGVWLLDAEGGPILASRIPPLASNSADLPVGDARAIVTAALGISADAQTYSSVVSRPTGADLYVATPVLNDASAGSGRSVLIARVSVPALLAEAQTGLGGSIVAYSGASGEGGLALEPNVHTLNTPAGDPVPLDVPGFERWSIAVRPPPLQLDFPVALLLLAIILGSGAVAIVWWMARQVIQPAEQLEQASTRLGLLYETARTASLQDSLTGLGNHRAFMEEFDRRLEESRRYKTPVSLLLIDLDDFKLVNDSAGHAVGDQMLMEMARLLRVRVRRSDRSFRIGGDEFAVLMPHTDAEGALIVGRRLLAACTGPRPVSAFPRSFAFSGGISACPEFSRSRSELFAQADAALYDRKQHGRTAVGVFDPIRERPALEPAARSELSAQVARVIAVGALKAVYQPIVDLRTGSVLGFEGLVRPAPDSGFGDAGSLFSAAEASGRTMELDHACIEAVIRGAGQLAADQTLSINVSPRSLEAPEFNARSLAALVTRHGMEPRRVTLELTEREEVEDVERLRSVITSCQAAGLRVAADDVGAGNAGLRLLSQINFDVVKIDMSLVQEGEVHDGALAVLRALSELATRRGATVVAEGVETPGQLWVVQELAMNAAQGYLLGRPTDSPTLRVVDLDALLALNGGVEPLVFRRRAALRVVAR